MNKLRDKNRKGNISFLSFKDILILIFIILALIGAAPINWSSMNDYKAYNTSTLSYVKATVIEITSMNLEKDSLDESRYLGVQNVIVEVLEGDYAGQEIEIVNNLSQTHNVKVSEGQKVIVCVDAPKNTVPYFTIFNYDRSSPLFLILLIFVIGIIAVGGKKGLRALAGLGVTIAFILLFYVQGIFHGKSVVGIAILTMLLVTAASLYLLNGISKKTVLTILATFCGLVVAGVFCLVCQKLLHITGYNLEDAEALLLIGQNTGLEVKHLLVAGDPQIGSGKVATDTEGWISTMTAAVGKFSDVSFLLSVGDQVNSASGNALENEYQGFLAEEALLSSLPFAPTVGNHDSNTITSYVTHNTLPNMSTYGSSSDEVAGDEDYSFRYGNTIFMMLNTNNSSIAEHKAFIEETLSSNQDATWRVVAFHQSIYSVARHVNDGNIADLRTGLSPILVENDIDIVLMGHDHVYARSYIMGGETGMVADVQKDAEGNALTEITDADGVQYVTFNSASGSKYYDITNELFEYTAVQSQEKTPNYSYVSVDEDSFAITTYRSTDNSVVDTITIKKTVDVTDDENTDVNDGEADSDDSKDNTSEDSNLEDNNTQDDNTSSNEDSTSTAGAADTEIQEDWDQIAGMVTDMLQKNTDFVLNVLAGQKITVPENVINMLSGNQATLALHTGRGVTFSLTGTEVTAEAKAADLNLNVQIGSIAVPADVIAQKTAEAVSSKQISIENQNNFGMNVNMHLGLKAENAGKYANLYRYNSISRQLEYQGSYLITEAGQAMFGLSKGGEYLVTVTAKMPAEQVSSDYIVVSGDTLSVIASRKRIRLADLLADNPQIADANRIYPGQKIRIR